MFRSVGNNTFEKRIVDVCIHAVVLVSSEL